MKTVILATIITFVVIRAGIWIVMILTAIKSGVFKSDNVKKATEELVSSTFEWALENSRKIQAGLWIMIGVTAFIDWKVSVGIFLGSTISSLLANKKIDNSERQQNKKEDS